VVTIVQRYGVEAFFWLRFHQHAQPRAVRGKRSQGVKFTSY
jgi:hypothetical protein